MSPLPAAMVLIVAILITGVGQVYSHHKARKLFIEIQTLRAQRDDLEIEWGQLQLEESTLATEAVVDQAARKRLRMYVPHPEAVVYIQR